MSRDRTWLLAALAFALTTAVANWVSAQSMFVERGAIVLGGASYDARSASLADIDNDGDLDLFFQGGSGAQRLFRNNYVGSGALTFTNITTASNITSGVSLSWSAAWGDYDGDGFVDVFVGQTNSGASGDVLRNNGDNTFTNTSVSVGLNDPGFHQNVAWADIDGDRDLDLIIGMEGPEKHEIYLHQPNGSFTPVGAAVGFQQAYGTKSYGMAIGDTDGDGDLDVYISTCISGGGLPNNFYENRLAQTGTLSFVDIADANGTQNFANSYHSEFVDMDDDGDLDLFMVGADQQQTRLFRNDGANKFTDVAQILGHNLLSDIGGDLNGGRAIDYDNDGDLDLFMHDDLSVGGAKPSNQARKLYRNDGNWNFVDVTAEVGIAATNEGAYDSTWGDLDLDGDMDLVAPTRSGIPERVFLSNASQNGNHWLYVRLDGATQNTTAIGASLYATINEGTAEEKTLRREANTNAGTFNQSDLPIHFGLGAAAIIDVLRIVWPDGMVQILHNVATNQYLTINIPGDFNGDGKVDQGDLAAWQASFGVNDGADADYDGDTDGADYMLWQQHYGAGVVAAAPRGGSSVPEPNALALLIAAIAAATPFRRRR